jgi:hypothetical protein
MGVRQETNAPHSGPVPVYLCPALASGAKVDHLSLMRPSAFLSAVVLAALLVGAPMVALAQTAPPVGAKVKDDKGKAVGEVVRVIMGPGGRPAQVLVKVDRVLRTLPVEALMPTANGAFATVLSRAEIAALPPSD